MSLDPENLYRRLGRLIETMPELSTQPTSSKIHLWLAQAHALVMETGNIADAAMLTVEVSHLNTGAWGNAVHNITAIVFRALAKAELNAPPGVGGMFIPVGNSFDAFAAISKILKSATHDVLIVDAYMDETALTEFGIAVPENVRLRLLTDKEYYYSTLEPAIKKWIEQYATKRPIEVRLTVKKTLHDRSIFIDNAISWSITQSFKDIAKRSPAEIIRSDDNAEQKIAVFEEIWNRSTPLLPSTHS